MDELEDLQLRTLKAHLYAPTLRREIRVDLVRPKGFYFVTKVENGCIRDLLTHL